MDLADRDFAQRIRAMSSTDAADFLLDFDQTHGSTTSIAKRAIQYRSWKIKDQHRLATAWLQGVVAANSGFYAMFLKFMSVKNFAQHIRASKYKAEDLRLLLYHLSVELRAAVKNEHDQLIADELLNELKQRSLENEISGRSA